MSGSSSSRTAGVVTIVMTLVGWSSIPLFLNHFAEKLDPWTSNGWRYGFSALLWSPVLVWGLFRRTLPPGIWRAAILPSAINTAAQAVFCWAHYKIDPGLLAFGLRSNIVFVTLGAAILFAAERRVIRRPWFLAGVGMVIAGTTGTVLLGKDALVGATMWGVLLALVSGAGFAAYALAVRATMHGVNAIQSFAVISLYTACGSVALMLALGERFGAPALDLIGVPARVGRLMLPGDEFVLLLVSAVIGIALGHVFYYFSINHLGLAASAGVVQLQPFLVAVGSRYLFGEQLSGPQWAAGAVAITGALAILIEQHRAARGRYRELAELPTDATIAAAVAEHEPRSKGSTR